jgi:hypothetical protein
VAHRDEIVAMLGVMARRSERELTDITCGLRVAHVDNDRLATDKSGLAGVSIRRMRAFAVNPGVDHGYHLSMQIVTSLVDIR